MMDLTLSSWTLAILPVLVLLAGILWFKWEAAQVGAVSWFIALVVASTYFGADWRLLSLANSKGMSLSLFVLLIIWGAVLLYNVVEKSGAIKVIGAAMEPLTERGVVAPEDFPLLRHLYAIIEEDAPLEIPWKKFFGGMR